MAALIYTDHVMCVRAGKHANIYANSGLFVSLPRLEKSVRFPQGKL